MVRAAGHEEVDAVGDGKSQLCGCPEGVKRPAGETWHGFDVDGLPGPEDDFSGSFHLEVPVGERLVGKRIEWKDDVFAGGLNVHESSSNVFGTKLLGSHPEQKLLGEVSEPIDDDCTRSVGRIPKQRVQDCVQCGRLALAGSADEVEVRREGGLWYANVYGSVAVLAEEY